MITERPFLYVALDYADRNSVYQSAEELADVDSDRFGYKINLDFFLLNGVDAVKPVLDIGRRVFADLKMWNGKRTMISIATYLDRLGVSAINAYSHAGVDFLEKLSGELSDECNLFGLTVLTHYTDEDCQRVYGCNVRDAVRRLSLISRDAGCDGIIVPGTALNAVEDLDLIKVVPGIRPGKRQEEDYNPQEQIVTPRGAVESGANILVCGSPIMKSKNRKDALRRVLDEIDL